MEQNISLIKQLKEFGLNPSYWMIKKLNDQRNKWVVIHKKEQDLCLIGQTEERRKWDYLEWLI